MSGEVPSGDCGRAGDTPYTSSLAEARPEVPASSAVFARAENRLLPRFAERRDAETWREPFYFIQVRHSDKTRVLRSCELRITQMSTSYCPMSKKCLRNTVQ